jgi:hypothetical protein
LEHFGRLASEGEEPKMVDCPKYNEIVKKESAYLGIENALDTPEPWLSPQFMIFLGQ